MSVTTPACTTRASAPCSPRRPTCCSMYGSRRERRAGTRHSPLAPVPLLLLPRRRARYGGGGGAARALLFGPAAAPAAVGEEGSHAGARRAPNVASPPAARLASELSSRVAQGAPADYHAQPVQAAGLRGGWERGYQEEGKQTQQGCPPLAEDAAVPAHAHAAGREAEAGPHQVENHAEAEEHAPS